MTNITTNIEVFSTFCIENTSANVPFWHYFGYATPLSMIIVFTSMKYGFELKMLSFCGIFGFITETATLSAVLGGITYSLVLWRHTFRFVYFDCSFYEYPFVLSDYFYGLVNWPFLNDINSLYIITVSVGLIFFIIIFGLKLILMKKSELEEEAFKKTYKDEGYSCKQQFCCWLAAKIKYQWDKFWGTSQICGICAKMFLFIVGFSLCASLQPLYSIGNAYDEDYSKAANENCLCIEKGIGTAISLYGSAITAIIVIPILCLIAALFACIIKTGFEQGCAECVCWYLIVFLLGLSIFAYAVFVIILALFIIASPFIMLYVRFADLYQSIFIVSETGALLSVSQVITSIFFVEMLVHAFNSCGCSC